MKNIISIIVLAFIFIGFATFFLNRNVTEQKPKQPTDSTIAIIHKTPTCGCCGVYSSYMKKEGYHVEINDMADLSGIKQSLGVPSELESCHTSEIGGYVVEGHIPNEAIERLLSEKPNIKGIGMAGMPAGSPGMPGPKTNDFVIYEITNENTRGEIFMTI